MRPGRKPKEETCVPDIFRFILKEPARTVAVAGRQYALCVIGQLYLNGGTWKCKQIVPTKWIDESTKEHSICDQQKMSYGYLWWIIDDKEHIYATMGDGGNVIYVNAKKGIVVSIASLYTPHARDRIELIKKYIEPAFENDVLRGEKGRMMRKKQVLMSIIIFVLLPGCGKANEGLEPQTIASEAGSEAPEAFRYEDYSGTWTQGGITKDKVYEEGGTILELAVTDGNKAEASVFTQQAITERFADIEDITGVIENKSFDFDFTDDGWGGTGTLRFTFREESIHMEVINYQMAEDNGSGYGISGTYDFFREGSQSIGNGEAIEEIQLRK